jgi:hypothetical protein
MELQGIKFHKIFFCNEDCPFYTWYLSPKVHIPFFPLKMEEAGSSERLLFMELQGMKFQKTLILILTKIRTSNLK